MYMCTGYVNTQSVPPAFKMDFPSSFSDPPFAVSSRRGGSNHSLDALLPAWSEAPVLLPGLWETRSWNRP